MGIIIQGQIEGVASRKAVPGFDGRYSALKDGSIYSEITNRILKPSRKRNGYLGYSLFDKDKKVKYISGHKIIALTYIPNPNNKPQVNHKNGDKQDNRVENLEWATLRENNSHRCANLKSPLSIWVCIFVR